MPELPEVELISQSLAQLITGRRIDAAELLRAKLAPYGNPESFAESLKSSQIISVSRRGKHILFHMDTGITLIVHLRMTGRFMLIPQERLLPKHTHAIFYMDDESRLIFEDQRHFGFMRVLESSKVFDSKELRHLAPEPLGDDFDLNYFYAVLKRSKRNIKELILDQTKVCGVGNIYASESLFLAGINPRRKSNSVSKQRADILLTAIKDVLYESISHGSTLNIDPENIEGSYYGGAYENHWRVYDQEGEACMNCQQSIKRIVQGGRSTFYCPKCQK